MKQSLEKKIELLDSLEKHGGWLLLHEEARREIEQATTQLAFSRSMSAQEQDWRRGMIASALLILEMPKRLRDRLKTEAALQASINSNAPAKAGAKKGSS